MGVESHFNVINNNQSPNVNAIKGRGMENLIQKFLLRQNVWLACVKVILEFRISRDKQKTFYQQ